MQGPLEGLRIIEMGQLIAIPFAMKMLADMGAQVIRLESTGRLESYRSDSVYQNDVSGEFWNKGANFYEQNRNKLGITLDLSKPEGLQILLELISVADIFAENFTPRVIKNFGLEYEDLRKLKPDIIMVSSTGYGFYGPWANFGATGPATEGAAGLAYQTGYLGGQPVMSEIPYTDYTSGEHTVFAVMAALMHRLKTGQGQFVDISQTQATSSTIPEVLMDFSANGRSGQRIGNQDVSMSPHGCYPCKGDDRWISVAVTTDAQWQSLCRVLEESNWATDIRFEDSLSRWKNR
ncbi:MAG: CoA transferase, partial [Chloroflexota bacterium]|nr:CoA transferase [Chloroflexota bacterium]